MADRDVSNDTGTAPSNALVLQLYDELRSIARREHYRAGSPQTLQTTALVNEAFLKLRNRAEWQSRNHFLGSAATAMRHILIDAARARLTAKRNGALQPLEDWHELAALDRDDSDLVTLGEALGALNAIDPRLAQVVDCRFFMGYDDRETAEILGVTDRTVRRLWVQARAILYAQMGEGD